MLTALILAAGESKRMGSPKALLLYHDRTFLQHLLDITRHPRIGERRVVLGAGAPNIIERAGLDPAITVLNPDWKSGQLSSIQAGIRHLKLAPVDGVMLFLVDHPLITSALVDELIEAFYRSGKSIVLPTFNGRRGHPVIFSSKLFDELLTAPADTGARAVVWKHQQDLELVPTVEEGCVLNLNDPASFRNATGQS